MNKADKQMNEAIRALAGRRVDRDDEDEREGRLSDYGPTSREDMLSFETPDDLMNAHIRRASGR